MSTKLVYGKVLVVDENTVIPSGALYIEHERIVDYGTYAEIAGKYKADRTLGSAETLIIPGLVNAHGHGKGLTDFQRGQVDDTLETWKWRSFPPIDPFLDTCWTCLQLLGSGVTTTMHNHGLVDPGAFAEEFAAVLRAYKRCGIRVAFAPSLSTENLFVYGEDQTFLETLSPELRAFCEGMLKRSAAFGEEEYLETVRRLHGEHSSPEIQIMHGPMAPQWVRQEALQQIRKQADQLGLRIHIHVQQTQLQKLYGLKRYGKSLLAYLAELGFLAPDVTCGHCVWISEEDIELLRLSGASVTHHPGCNLRVRNGISPVFELDRRGVVVAIGMDEKEISDDKDYLAELRLAAKLHRLDSPRLDSPCLSSRDIFRMGTRNGAAVLGFGDWIGTLERGKRADLVLLDLEGICDPYTYEGHDPLDLLLYRGNSRHVRTVLVNGEVLLDRGKFTHIDRDEIVRKLREAIPADYRQRFEAGNRLMRQLRRAIADHFRPWHEEIESWEKQPYYFMNSRV
ncbi:MAG: amidohydrolase family protein [Spirochaetaceae bacterium]|nr:MAG: amidohydrolase family protein [Spirochaetaceae bacterium]